MAANRTYKPKKDNNEAINAFLNIAVGSVRVASINAMQKIARRGINTLTHNVASFGDYSGVLLNSYQAVILRNGKIGRKGNFGGDFTFSGDVIRDYKHEFTNGDGSVRLVTSYNTTGVHIGYKSVDRKGRSIARRTNSPHPVNPLSAETIPMPHKKNYKGFGRDMSTARTYQPSVKFGLEVIFNNPTPYAKHVMENNYGSHVMPLGGASQIIPRGIAFSITSAEITNAVKKAKQRMKK